MSDWPNCGHCMPHEPHWWTEDRGERRRDCGGCTEEVSARLLAEEREQWRASRPGQGKRT